jgi:peroxiredoxin
MKRALHVVVLMVIVLFATGIAFAEMEMPEVGDTAPNFVLKEAGTGNSVDLAKLREKAPYTCITFTNSACAACRREMKFLAKMKDELGDQMQLVAVFTDVAGEAGAQRTISMFKDTFIYLMDSTFSQPPQFGFQYTPGLVIVDKKGKIAYIHGGFTNESAEEMKQEITKLVK